MNLKKNLILLILTSFIFSLMMNLKSDDIDDEIDLLTSNFDASTFKAAPAASKSYSDILSVLLAFDIPTILSRDFYLKTHPIFKRPIIYSPIFDLYHTDHICQDLFLKFSFFGNKTHRAFFTDSSPFIKSFIALDDPILLGLLEKLPFLIKGVSIPSIFALFKNTKKEERQAGLMIQALKNFKKNISLEVTVPLLYQEYNYFLTPEETEDIKSLFGGTTEEQEKGFHKMVVADKFGFGDAKVKLGFLVLEKENICAKFGIQSTIPTAFPIKRGLVGSYFVEKTCLPPMFDFATILRLVDNNDPRLLTIGKDFLFRAADWLSAIVLDTPLGNNGHFGLGFFFEPQVRVNHGVTFKAIASAEYFFPAKERRAFLIVKNPNDFNAAKLTEDLKSEAASKRDVLFLNQQVINTIFPPFFMTDVKPGFMVDISVGPLFKLREWNFGFGYNFWYQEKEKINYVYSCENLNICKGTKPRGYQSKIFANLSYNRVKLDRDWALALNYEDTLAMAGVGRDFSMSISFEVNY